MTRAAAQVVAGPDPAVVLARATLRAAELLEMSQGELGKVLGLSAATVSRLAHGQVKLEPGSKSWELATLFVRLFRSLDAIVGSNDNAARAWFASENRALGGVPRQLVREAAGLVRTV
ncbi:MAG: MbcA/ParS/Xre antitoxin family protein, partial [Steroidobacteraceae bacterium]|nr:MbcA/ParS/Xre antitoxin family protein [Steroidobacteraceae bacterium]